MIDYGPESVVSNLSPHAAMWVCAPEDTMVPIEESRGMYEQAGFPKRLAIPEGLKHHDLYCDEGLSSCWMLQCSGLVNG